MGGIHGVPRSSIEFNSVPWNQCNTIELNGTQRASMELNGFRWTSSESVEFSGHRIQWTSAGPRELWQIQENS